MNNKIKELLFTSPLLREFTKKLLIRRGDISTESAHFDALEVAEKVLLDPSIDRSDLLVGVVRDGVYPYNGFEGFVHRTAYYPKYVRFLKNNNIPFEYFDIHRHDWQDQAKRFRIILWRTSSYPADQTEAMQKIYVMEKMGIRCLPSFDDVFKYEDKVEMHYFFQFHALPEIPTFVSCSEKDALEFAERTSYPIVSKVTTASASKGVEIIRNRKNAQKLIKQVFGYRGKRICWDYLRQKDYVYFQRFIEDAAFDLRVIVVGNSLFGYYRYPDKGDFRASGSGHYEKKAIPVEALDIAWKTKQAYGAHCLATDFVYSAKENKYYIIESSICISVDTAVQMAVDDQPGRYIRDGGGYTFEKGQYWIQELTLQSFFESH